MILRSALSLAALSLLGIGVYNPTNIQQPAVQDTNKDVKETVGQYLINTDVKIAYTDKDIECLAKNIYYEAGVEGKLGRYAVAHVTINRLKTGRWGTNICQVVYSPKQFSWTLKKVPKPNATLWQECLRIARDSVSGVGVSGLGRSLFYHTDYIKTPKWAQQQPVTVQIGRHLFYNTAYGWRVDLNV